MKPSPSCKTLIHSMQQLHKKGLCVAHQRIHQACGVMGRHARSTGGLGLLCIAATLPTLHSAYGPAAGVVYTIAKPSRCTCQHEACSHPDCGAVPQEGLLVPLKQHHPGYRGVLQALWMDADTGDAGLCGQARCGRTAIKPCASAIRATEASDGHCKQQSASLPVNIDAALQYCKTHVHPVGWQLPAVFEWHRQLVPAVVRGSKPASLLPAATPRTKFKAMACLRDYVLHVTSTHQR